MPFLRRQDIRRILTTSGSSARMRLKKSFPERESFDLSRPSWTVKRRERKGLAMKRTLIRYRTKPEAADANAALVEAVFAELKTKRPEGVRYMTLRLEGDVFVHLVESDAVEGPSPLQQLDAFQAFQRGIRERCVEGPDPRSATVVGNYRMLDDA
jgi:hypothetical protein